MYNYSTKWQFPTLFKLHHTVFSLGFLVAHDEGDLSHDGFLLHQRPRGEKKILKCQPDFLQGERKINLLL